MRLVQRLKALLNRLVKPERDRVLARLRAHMALAVNDDLRHVILHVTTERSALATELSQRFAAELAPVRRQLDDLNLCNDGLLREVVRLQREVQQLLEASERLSPQTLPATGSFGDAPRLKIVDDRQSRAA